MYSKRIYVYLIAEVFCGIILVACIKNVLRVYFFSMYFKRIHNVFARYLNVFTMYSHATFARPDLDPDCV